MKHALIIGAFTALLFGAGGAQAGCFADYKAKRDNPLRLHYGVVEVTGPCTVAAATPQIATRLSTSGWTLLNVLSVFDDAGLDERKQSAGQFYLRF